MGKTPDPGAIDRKSRPIYDLLNRGEYKATIKQCNQALSKYHKHGLFSILKAFALDRMGNANEALLLAEEVSESGTADAEVLHHTSNLLRSHGEFQLLLQMYKKSAAAQPQDVGLLQELFLAHVRLGNVLEQQQVAMKISKAVPGEMQTFWVVCSMLAQVARARAGTAVSQMQPDMLLKLAGALAAKQLQAVGALSYEALLVYMDVLQAQGDLDRCMELLEGPSAAAVQMPHELARLKAQTALAAGNCSTAAELLKDALETSVPDDWAAYVLLFCCCLPRTAWPCEHAGNGIIGVEGGVGHLRTRLLQQEFWQGLEGPQSEVAVHEVVTDLQAFLASVIDLVEAGKFSSRGGLIRGPYLAKVDLAWRQVRLGVAPATMLSSAMLEYFKRFKTKAVAHVDLQAYGQALPPELRTWLTAALGDERKAVQTSIQKNSDWTQNSIRVTLNCLLLEQHLGLPAFTSASTALEYAHTCMHLYGQWRPSLAACDKRDLGVGEEVIELACCALLAAFFISKDRGYVAQAAVLLALAKRQHPHSPGLLLSLAALQMLLGNGERALESFQEVTPRSVQLDSLAHHVTPVLAELPSPKHRTLLRMVLSVRSSHEGAVAEALADSYSQGSYSKVLEFGEFKRRGRDSMTYLEADCQQALGTLRTAAKTALTVAGSGKVATAAQRLGAEAWSLLEEAQLDDSMLGCDASELWVNDDLSQRPAWLAPHACESVLAALEWWEEAQQASGSQRAAAGVRWWQLPKAATSSGSEAATWRASRTASLSLVSVQPQLMANILRTCSGGGSGHAEPDEQKFDVAAAMEKALQAAGVSWLEVCEWHSGQDWSVERTLLQGELPGSSPSGAAEAKRLPLRQLLRTLTLSSLATASAMHALVLRTQASGDGAEGAEPDGAVDGSAALKCVTVTSDVLATVCMRIMHGLRVPLPPSDADGDTAAGGLLDGAVLHAMLVVVHHSMLWLAALSLAVGSGLTPAAAIADDRQKAARSAGLAAVRRLVAAVQRICEGLEGELAECRAALGEGGGVCDAVSTRHRRCLAEVADEEAVLKELKSLGTAQRAALADVDKEVGRIQAACRRLSTHVGEG